MVAVQNPLAHMEGDGEMTAYVAVLERRLVLLTIQEVRFRGLLEALTGEPWDDQYADLGEDEVNQLAVNSLMKGLGITKLEAEKQVKLHRQRANSKNLVVNTDDPKIIATQEQLRNLEDSGTQTLG